MAAPNIQTSSIQQTVGGQSGTTILGPAIVDGDLTVSGTITGLVNGGLGGGGLAVAAAGRSFTDEFGVLNVSTPLVQANSVITTQVINSAGGAAMDVPSITPGEGFVISSPYGSPVEVCWMMVNPQVE